jgi:hypothetical protein
MAHPGPPWVAALTEAPLAARFGMRDIELYRHLLGRASSFEVGRFPARPAAARRVTRARGAAGASALGGADGALHHPVRAAGGRSPSPWTGPDSPRVAHGLELLTDELNATPAHLPGDRRPLAYQLAQP